MVKKEVKEQSKDLLLENFIALQKKITETAKDLKDMKVQLSELLTIFKKAEQDFKQEKHINLAPRVEEKLDQILKQNKAIIEGLVAVGENVQVPSEDTVKVEKETKKKKKSLYDSDEEEPTEEEKSDDSSNYDLEPLPEFNF
jgi:hypothetical protein